MRSARACCQVIFRVIQPSVALDAARGESAPGPLRGSKRTAGPIELGRSTYRKRALGAKTWPHSTSVGVSSGTGAVDEQVYSTTPDDAFRWDPTAKQWIFNQNTKNLLVGKAYTYWIYLADGTHIEYKFGTK
jgi:hypothetical protein